MPTSPQLRADPLPGTNQHRDGKGPSQGGIPVPSMPPGNSSSPCGCSKNGRNLVVFIDGTSNMFGLEPTNVLAFYRHIEKDQRQTVIYNSGIGTEVKGFSKFRNLIDQGLALSLKKNIVRAYHWLSENYEAEDRIYLFGFSRGAYQVRVLAGMIEMLGLTFRHNEAQVPIAYDICKQRSKGRVSTELTEVVELFRSTFARDVKVHFLGAWYVIDTIARPPQTHRRERDTVSSVRFETQDLHLSKSTPCFFRQALALDERRVLFLPEYVHGGICQEFHNTLDTLHQPPVKEVWFAGNHSDMCAQALPTCSIDLTVHFFSGGKNGDLVRTNPELFRMPLLWMKDEAMIAGLRFDSESISWNFQREESPLTTEKEFPRSWRFLEYIWPFPERTYLDESSTKRSVVRYCLFVQC
ncbi:hypothetical protein C8R44DRAFT_941306 [Mycena epipterygia]|nr:hypothetical protein C8R44DRAFT_941306 [Mycena epipterygia]